MKKILILAANPTDTTQLRLGDEVRKIQNARRQATNRQQIQIFNQWVRVDDLRQVLFEHKPNVVHFCGHGEGDNGLVLENEYGEKQLVSSESLAGLFKNFQEHVDCVVLNACYSEAQAEIIHEHINCVIGMNQSISDKAAIEFATGFYEALTNGANYKKSFDLGCNAIDLKNIPESQKPQIKIKDTSKSLLDLDSRDSKPKQKSNFKPIKYIPNFGNKNFIGRQDKLVKIHNKLYEENNNRIAISAVSGMGGIGKTELAIQYALKYENNYSGGICWLNVRGTNLAVEIIQFVQLQMGLEVPQKDAQGNVLTLEQQVDWCWQNWQPPEGLVLVIFDDVTEYKDIKNLLPRTNNQRFKLLITTRRRNLDPNFVDIPLDVLSEDDALSLLINILGEEDRRIETEVQIQKAKDLCKWLGYLPLGLELVGRYLVEEPDLSMADYLEELKKQRLRNQALDPDSEDSGNKEITARLGVSAAFNLTWEKLDSKTQEVGELLSLFAADTIAWKYVESVSESLNWGKEDVRNAKNQLYGRNVIKKLEKSEASYQIHPLIREFLQTKLQASAQINELKQAFTNSFIEIAQTIPQTPTLEDINSVKNAIPHLTEVAENQLDALSHTNLFWVLYSLGNFYEGQGLYVSAEPWYQQCVLELISRLGENHPDTAASLNNLALLYYNMGRYDEAEPLHKQALELRKQLLGENHPSTAQSLNNLANLYYNMGRYDEAEPLHKQALELKKQLLGENHPDTAASLNNLASLYYNMGRYDEAEPLHKQALELRKQLLGENHPDTAASLNNLAYLYDNQGKYEEAEPLYKQALEIAERVLGENHPHRVLYRNNFEKFRKKQREVTVEQQETSGDDSWLGGLIKRFFG
jgi:tetratricopeptide (TPR) repeat protein